MSYGEFAKLTATPLDRAVDDAVDRENRRALGEDIPLSPQEQRVQDMMFLSDAEYAAKYGPGR